jgi:F0F1-type ATP synthase assembly protein I
MATDRTGKQSPSMVGFAMIGSEMAGFTVLGLAIDYLTGLTPWVTVGLTLLGFLAAFLHLTRIVRVQRHPDGNPRNG